MHDAVAATAGAAVHERRGHVALWWVEVRATTRGGDCAAASRVDAHASVNASASASANVRANANANASVSVSVGGGER